MYPQLNLLIITLIWYTQAFFKLIQVWYVNMTKYSGSFVTSAKECSTIDSLTKLTRNTSMGYCLKCPPNIFQRLIALCYISVNILNCYTSWHCMQTEYANNCSVYPFVHCVVKDISAEKFEESPIIFGDFMKVGASQTDRIYEELTNLKKVSSVLSEVSVVIFF